MRTDVKRINKEQLVNLSSPDHSIQHVRTSDPRLYQAVSNLGSSVKSIVNNNFPAPPVAMYTGRAILPGVQAVANDILSNRYHVILPVDPTGNWVCKSITLIGCRTTLKIASAVGAFSLDFKVSQKHGTTSFKTLFKSGFNPQIPQTFLTARNVKFAINTLYDDDLIRVDILVADGVAANAESVLFGSYNWINET